MRDEKVYTLLIVLKFDLELCAHDLRGLRRMLDGNSKPVMHSNRTLGFVIVSRDLQAVLMDRLARHLDVHCVENYHLFPCPYSLSAMNGSMDPFVTAAAEAHAEVRKRREAKNMPPPKTIGEVFLRSGVKKSERSAAVKMGMKGSRRRNPARDT